MRTKFARMAGALVVVLLLALVSLQPRAAPLMAAGPLMVDASGGFQVSGGAACVSVSSHDSGHCHDHPNGLPPHSGSAWIYCTIPGGGSEWVLNGTNSHNLLCN
jgi:hypothetical protein